jgi:hypothetical protein
MRIDDGHPTTIDFLGPSGSGGTQGGVDYDVAGVLIWEKTVTPPGMQGGGANDTTTMRNTRWRTMAPKKLMTLSEMSVTFAYDPEVYDNLVDMMQINQQLRINWPDSSTLLFWGFFDDLSPNEVSEGEQPEADATVIPTNQNASGVETAPVYTAGTP